MIGFDDQFQYEEFKKPLDQRHVPETQVMGKEAVQLVKDFAAKPDRVKY